MYILCKYVCVLKLFQNMIIYLSDLSSHCTFRVTVALYFGYTSTMASLFYFGIFVFGEFILTCYVKNILLSYYTFYLRIQCYRIMMSFWKIGVHTLEKKQNASFASDATVSHCMIVKWKKCVDVCCMCVCLICRTSSFRREDV